MSRRSDEAEKKLAAEVARLAREAIFGTLSESYRTCGRPSCHCHGRGPKHGPHLHVSYRGEQGKTTGYYVAKSAEQAVRDGVESWNKLQGILRELAENNRDRILAQARKARSR